MVPLLKAPNIYVLFLVDVDTVVPIPISKFLAEDLLKPVVYIVSLFFSRSFSTRKNILPVQKGTVEFIRCNWKMRQIVPSVKNVTI